MTDTPIEPDPVAHGVDLEALTGPELLMLRLDVDAEQRRRDAVQSIPSQIDALATQYRALLGIRDGTPWRQPTGAHDAVEPGGKRVFQGHLWENTSGAFLATRRRSIRPGGRTWAPPTPPPRSRPSIPLGLLASRTR